MGGAMGMPWEIRWELMGVSLRIHEDAVGMPWEIRGALMWTSWATHGQISIAFLTAHCCSVLAAFFKENYKMLRLNLQQ